MMKNFLAPIVASCLVLISCSVLAVTSDEAFDDPVLQARYDKFTQELRCLVCQNQTVADSNAGLAQDLRNQTREMLLSGATDEEIITYMTERYGDFVLYRPPLKPKTWLLWSAPVVFLLLGMLIAARIIRHRSGSDDLPVEGEEAFEMTDIDTQEGGRTS
ncbi:MAG: cytochrome c-type biogenesis protein [Gammaproteobacteria bacterium]